MFHVVYYHELGLNLNEFLEQRFLNRLCELLFCTEDYIRLYNGDDEQNGFVYGINGGVDRYFSQNRINGSDTIILFYVQQNEQGEWYAEFVDNHQSELVTIDKNIFKDPSNKSLFNDSLELKKHDFKVCFYLNYAWEKPIDSAYFEFLKQLVVSIPKEYFSTDYYEFNGGAIALGERVLTDKHTPHIACLLDSIFCSNAYEHIGICSNMLEYAILVGTFEHYVHKEPNKKYFKNTPIFVLDYKKSTFQIWYNFQQLFNSQK